MQLPYTNMFHLQLVKRKPLDVFKHRYYSVKFQSQNKLFLKVYNIVIIFPNLCSHRIAFAQAQKHSGQGLSMISVTEQSCSEIIYRAGLFKAGKT